MSDEIEKLGKEIDAIKINVDEAIKKGLVNPNTAIGINFELHIQTMKLQNKAQKEEIKILERAEKSSKMSLIVSIISLSASLIALGVGTYTILITVLS